MAVEEVVRIVMGHVLYWGRFVLVIALIYAIIKLFIGDKGLGDIFKGLGSGGTSGGSGGSGGRSGSGDSGRGSRDSGDKELTDEDAMIDFKNLGKVKFLVRNVDGEPVENVTISVWPSRAKLFFKTLGRRGRYYIGRTNKWGVWPGHDEHMQVPSGTLRYRAEYRLPPEKEHLTDLTRKDLKTPGTRGLRGTHKSPTHFVVKSDFEVQAGQEHVIAIELPFHSEQTEGFQPHITRPTGPRMDGAQRVFQGSGVIKGL